MPTVSRWPAVAVAAAAVAPLVSVLTYREWIDGAPVPYLLAQAASILAAVCACVWWGLSARPAWPAAPAWLVVPLALLVALPAPVVHAARLLNRRVALEGSLGATVEYGRVLAPVLQGAGTFSVAPGSLDLAAPAGSTAFVELHRPGDPGAQWRLPHALVRPGHARQREEVVWRAGVELEGRYFVLVEAGRVAVQVTDWGLLVTAPDATGDVKGEGVTFSATGGRVVEWTLRREDGRVRLLADGRELWSGGDPGPLAPVRLGETRTDGEHGGTMRLLGVRVRRWAA